MAIPRSWRPRRSWDIRRSVLIKLIRHSTWITSETGPLTSLPNHLAITSGVDINGVWVEPTPELVTGDLETFANVAGVEPCRIPGYWLFKKGSKVSIESTLGPDEKIVYALHGGGYVRLSAHPSDVTAAIAKGLLEHVGPVSRVFSLEYRLSVGPPYTPKHPFPAALLDALAGYNYLVNVLGFSPSNIIIEGDSAGGNLACALVRYLVEYKDSHVKLPPVPSRLVLLSPWCDLSTSHVTPGSSAYTCLSTDYLQLDRSLDHAKLAFVGPHGLGATENNRYISPASLNPQIRAEFKGYPRTFIMAGGAELLLDQIRTLKEKMVKDMGEGNVEYYEAPDGVHDYLVFAFHEPERKETFKAIAAWISL